MSRFPRHAWTFHPSLPDHFLAALDHARANWPTRSLIRGRLHPALALLEREDLGAQIFRLGVLVAESLNRVKDD